MAVAGVYRRSLPSPPAIDFGSPEGKTVFREALQDGTMEGFFLLIAHFQTQAEPAFCGLASLSVVLNALAIDPGRIWKGPWRWIDESMLECCEPLDKVKVEGMTLSKIACAGACAGAAVRAIRSNKSSVDKFRRHVVEACSSGDTHVIVSYDRQVLKQTGSGHFSPIGGYHRGRDLALILDVARFKYPPHWVPLPLLWEAVNTTDTSVANWRGFLLMSKPERHPSVLFTLSCKDELWRPISKYLIEEAPKLLRNADIKSTGDVISVIISLLPGNVSSFVKWVAEVQRANAAPSSLASEANLGLQAKVRILEELRKSKLYLIVSSWVTGFCASSRCSMPPLGKDDLSEALKSACCQGAAALSGMLSSSSLCCTRTSITHKSNDGFESLVVVGDLSSAEGIHSNVDVLVPTTHICDGEKPCTPLHPASADMLTMLLFALPPKNWFAIRNEGVQADLFDDTLVAKLPSNLQVEVENLRQQLDLVYRLCDIDTDSDTDFDQPASIERKRI